MPVYEETVATPLNITQQTAVYTQDTTPIYGSLVGAENYFASKIKNSVRDWVDADTDDKVAALKEATRRIEQLNFMGTRATDSQGLHFPTNELGTPNGLDFACYEIALKLLSGIDPDTEADNLSVVSQGYAGGRSSYDRSFVQEHTRAGIPSAFAWSILRPLLCDPFSIKLRRGD
jgi:hypothetical protein